MIDAPYHSKRVPVTCPVCGGIKTLMPSEYKKVVKGIRGECCSPKCGAILRAEKHREAKYGA
jgi:hypothetical protein